MSSKDSAPARGHSTGLTLGHLATQLASVIPPIPIPDILEQALDGTGMARGHGVTAGRAEGVGGAGGRGLMDAIRREFGGAVILYDGACPVCREYLNLLKIRELVGEVRLVNARDRPDLVADLRAAGYEINEGIVLAHDGGIVHGASALSVIARLGHSRRTVNRLSATLFRVPVAGEVLYGVLKAGRTLLLRLLGRGRI